MIEQNQQRSGAKTRRWWQAAFVLMLSLILVTDCVPEVSANALYLLTNGVSTIIVGGVEPVDAGRIVLTGATVTGETDVTLEAGRKLTIRQGETERYATSRAGETVSELLVREEVRVGPLELVRVDLSGDGILLEIGSDFVCYETVREAAAYTTVYAEDYTLPKGETKVTRAGENGYRDVTYEVVYADGGMVSRQAVAVSDGTAVNEVVSTGTLVQEARQGDTIDSVVRYDDGSGYLLLKSGDSLHFTGSMDVKCTAYSSAEPKVGTVTATGTQVHVGVVAVDRSVIPLGTSMFITTADGSYTYGMGHAEDTGVSGKTVDLYMDTLYECKQFGRRSSVVYFLDA